MATCSRDAGQLLDGFRLQSSGPPTPLLRAPALGNATARRFATVPNDRCAFGDELCSSASSQNVIARTSASITVSHSAEWAWSHRSNGHRSCWNASKSSGGNTPSRPG